jgi:hypothetical protein
MQNANVGRWVSFIIHIVWEFIVVEEPNRVKSVFESLQGLLFASSRRNDEAEVNLFVSFVLHWRCFFRRHLKINERNELKKTFNDGKSQLLGLQTFYFP